jgi:hypothetical protein
VLYGTVIVDESSMLTEDMLGALFDSLSGVKRYILVGDPSQLPPIGAGRPFVDIVANLRPRDYEVRWPTCWELYRCHRKRKGTMHPLLRSLVSVFANGSEAYFA